MLKMHAANLGLLAFLLATPVFAETAPAPASQSRVEQVLERTINQQKRVEDGLKAGSLTTSEAAQLEKGAAKIDKMESHALNDGKLSISEQMAINHAANKESLAIKRLNSNGHVGDPAKSSAQKMAAEVRHDINQEKRIRAGVENGSLTKHEAGKLQKRQAKAAHAQYLAGRDGHVGKYEHAHARKVQKRAGTKIKHKKHNSHVRHAVGKPIQHGAIVHEPILGTKR